MTMEALTALKQEALSHLATFSPVADGVGRLATIFVNLYVVDLPDGSWVLVDTGLPNLGWYVKRALAARYGADAKPAAIVLTHGHFDHAGSALELAAAWDVPVYAHQLELPYLTGRSNYAPQDPTRGGAISFLSRFFPTHGIDLGDRVKAIPDDGMLSELPSWKFHHTPGHTAGHVSLFREADRVLIAGDAVVTTDLDSWSAQLTWPHELSRPPTPLTPDWWAARESIKKLAALSPAVLAAGHGLPLNGAGVADDLTAFVDAMTAPAGGRYTEHSVQYAENGAVADVPPPVSDPVLWKLALGGAAAAIAVAAVRRLGDHQHTDEA